MPWIPAIAGLIPIAIALGKELFPPEGAGADDVSKAGADKIAAMRNAASAYGQYRPQMNDARMQAMGQQLSAFQGAGNIMQAMYGGGGGGGGPGGTYTPDKRAGLDGPLVPRISTGTTVYRPADPRGPFLDPNNPPVFKPPVIPPLPPDTNRPADQKPPLTDPTNPPVFKPPVIPPLPPGTGTPEDPRGPLKDPTNPPTRIPIDPPPPPPDPLDPNIPIPPPPPDGTSTPTRRPGGPVGRPGDPIPFMPGGGFGSLGGGDPMLQNAMVAALARNRGM